MSLKQRVITGGMTLLTVASVFVAPAFAGNTYYNSYGNNRYDGNRYMNNYDNYKNNNNCDCQKNQSYNNRYMPYMRYMNGKWYMMQNQWNNYNSNNCDHNYNNYSW